MRALRFDGREAVLADVPEPTVREGEALVAVTRVLLGPADVGAGAGVPAPLSPGRAFIGTLGSQFVGVVKSVSLPPDPGAALKSKSALVGKRVAVNPVSACATCDLCRAGLSAHCRARRVLGVHGSDGGCASLASVPLGSLLAVPDSVDDDRAVFASPLASALHAVNMLRAERTSYITILGDGLLAMLTAQALARMNKSVRLLTSRVERQRLCEQWGIKHRAPDEPGRRQDQDVVVDCTGRPEGLRLALQFVRPRGIVLLKGLGAGGPGWTTPVDLSPAVENEVQILGSRDGPLPDALRILSEDTIDVRSLISKRYRLDDAATALTAASEGLTGVLVAP